MKEYFAEKHIEEEVNKIYLEDEDVLIIGEFIEGEGDTYVLNGSAIIDGETYKEFQVEFKLLEKPEEETIDVIINMEWDWYDFLC